MAYQADVRDIKFQLFEWLPTEELLKRERFSQFERGDVEMVLDEALKLAQEQLAPTNKEGDTVGARFENGRVLMPEAYRAVYQKMCEGDWIGCVNTPELGGMGLPHSVGTAINELFFGANMSLSLTVLLTRGASYLIEKFGTEEMIKLFCERMYKGVWAGTMCLTEPQAGSDVGASKARAVKQPNGRYLIQGEKIFITSGDQDLTDNIIHAVLARVPGAPEGTSGLSLFIIPKIRVKPDGSLGEPNDVVCSRLEEKLGIHGSPTCSLVFGGNDRCEGFLLGEENQGMKLMFHMMNPARIEVGLQGEAVAAASYLAALDYAKTRLQSRHWSKLRDHSAPQVPIIEHPDVRRMLFTSAAYVQAMRALLLQTSYYIDMTQVTTGEEQERYQSYVEVLTPICKAWASDWGFRVTEWCLHVYGGYGYTKDYPAEQYLRDAKIAAIYEGTNGIQALDLVARKLAAKGGKPIRELLGMAESTFKKLRGDPQFMEPAWMLGAALKQIEDISKGLTKRPDAVLVVLLNSVPFLDMIGDVLGAHFLLDQAMQARTKLHAMLAEAGVKADDKDAVRKYLEGKPEAAFYHNKVQAAIHFAYRVLPQVTARAVAIRAGEMGPIEAVL
ncbi:MAG TPA: acyl-CoA dehydrogenase [Thermoanaerobaculaceae bacterium]|nr:acyl-CoA dehydrogenase [Thermoanaerobaculaceae bacterium]